MNYKEIAGFIIKEVQEKSTGFQYVVSSPNIIKELELIEFDIPNIRAELESRKEVADVEVVDSNFDVVLYTDYAPNYTDNLEFDIDICEKCGKFMPEGRILCKECV